MSSILKRVNAYISPYHQEILTSVYQIINSRGHENVNCHEIRKFVPILFIYLTKASFSIFNLDWQILLVFQKKKITKFEFTIFTKPFQPALKKGHMTIFTWFYPNWSQAQD